MTISLCLVGLHTILSNEIVQIPFVQTYANSIVFTPLFLGASLFVPTADDIGTPGRLAEWMDSIQATVTHLTPGTLIVREVTKDSYSYGTVAIY
jgi:hypothetical protein